MAGELCLDPGPFTLRELCWMVEGKRMESWEHTSCTLCMAANVSRDPKKARPFTPDDFNPYTKKRLVPMTKAEVLKKLELSSGKKQSS